MYLWCSQCHHARLKASWTVIGAKHGVCPTCGCSAYRNAVEWSEIAAVNSYEDIPDPKQVYQLQQVLFNLD